MTAPGVFLASRTTRRHALHATPAQARRSKRSLWYPAGLALYVAAALWLTGALGHDLTHQMIDGGPDPQATVFFLKWWPWAILHGQNPFTLRQLTWPTTYDAAWLTSVAGPALVGAPITALLGPIATWNLLLVLAPVAASMAMLFLLDSLEVPPVAAIAGGFVLGFSTFMAQEMQGHLFLTLIFPLPLLAALLVRRLRGKLRPAWFVVLSALLAAFLLYTSTELFATATLAGLFGLLLLLLWYRSDFVAAAKVLAKEVLGVVVGVGVLGAPLFAYALSDTKVASTAFQSPLMYSIDLLNYLVPTPTALVGGHFAGRLVSFSGNASEQFGYVGIVLAALCVVAMAQGLRRHRWAAPFAIWTIVVAVCALGPQLHLDSDATGLLPLPWGLASRFPVLKDALPTRLVLYVFLAVATWSALWVSWASAARQRVVRTVALLVGAALLLPNPAQLHWVSPTSTAAAVDGKLAAWVPPHTGLLIVPDLPRYGALWSEATEFRIPVTERPWGYDPYRPSYASWPFSSLNLEPTPAPGIAAQLEGFAAAHDDGAVAVPDGSPAWVTALDRLGWRHAHLPGATVYRVPEAVLAKYRHATPGALHTAFYRNEVMALERAGACYLRRGGNISALRPASAAARHCLDLAYVGSPASSEWTRYGGWLGPQGDQVGVGIASTGAQAAAVFAGTPDPHEWLAYDPIGETVTLAQMRHGPSGTYLAVGPFMPTPSRHAPG